MADERDDEPKIRIVDRRMLNEEERQGTAPPSIIQTGASQQTGATPKLEIIGGSGQASPAASETHEPLADQDDPNDGEMDTLMDTQNEIGDMEGDAPLSDEEAMQMQASMEAEQFAQIEAQMGRPLTEAEKASVREEMERQARQMASLDVIPMLQNLMAEMSARAAVHMGLMPNPYTRLIARNDTQARMAIDAFGAAYDIVKTQLDPASQREYARVLNDLRVNFSSITGIQSIGGGAPAGGGRIIH